MHNNDASNTPVTPGNDESISVLEALKKVFATKSSKNAPANPESSTTEKKKHSTVFLELLFIVAVVLFACRLFLDLKANTDLPGNESGFFQAYVRLFELTVKTQGRIPLWNPYLNAGMSYAADPMVPVYNPFVAIPVLALGTQAGFKVAVGIGFLVAALGAWWLAKVIGTGPFGRTWGGLLYALSGVPVAKFVQGHYLMVLAFGWIPFSLAALIAAYRTRQKRYLAIAAFGLAMIFLSGNVYYAYFSLFIFIILALFLLIDLSGFKPRINPEALKTLIISGVLAAGLIAVTLLPLAEYWPRLGKPTNPTLSDSHTFKQIFLDLTSKDPFRPDALSDQLRPEEYYAYTGWWPFIPIVLLPLAWKREQKRWILLILSILFFTFLWINIRDMPWANFVANTSPFNKFRYPTRMLVITTMSLSILSGVILDSVWQKLVEIKNASDKGKVPSSLARAGMVVLAVYGLFTVNDLLQTNRILTKTNTRSNIASQTYQWLKGYDPNLCYVGGPNNWYDAAISNEIYQTDLWNPFGAVRPNKGFINTRPVNIMPKYRVLLAEATAPANGQAISNSEGITIYQMLDAIPYVFTIPSSVLFKPADNSSITSAEVIPVSAVGSATNELEIILHGAVDNYLVVQTSFYPGWKVTIDGRGVQLLNISGFMGTAIQPGSHRYKFTFSPDSFRNGAIISLLTLIVTLTIFILDVRKPLHNSLQSTLATDWNSRQRKIIDKVLVIIAKLSPEKHTRTEKQAPVAGGESATGLDDWRAGSSYVCDN